MLELCYKISMVVSLKNPESCFSPPLQPPTPKGVIHCLLKKWKEPVENWVLGGIDWVSIIGQYRENLVARLWRLASTAKVYNLTRNHQQDGGTQVKSFQLDYPCAKVSMNSLGTGTLWLEDLRQMSARGNPRRSHLLHDSKRFVTSAKGQEVRMNTSLIWTHPVVSGVFNYQRNEQKKNTCCVIRSN